MIKKRKKYNNQTNIIELYEKLLQFVNQRTGIVKNIITQPRYNDEINLFKSNCFFTPFQKKEQENSTGIGTSLFESKFKSLTEAIERYCTSIQNPNTQKFGKYPDIKTAFDYKKFVSLTSEILKLPKFNPTNLDSFKWTKCYDVIKNKTTWCPSQLIHVPYNFNDEKIIRLPITTGCATWNDKNKAILNGIFELIERDAFMITWLCKKVPRHEIKFGKNFPIELKRSDFKIKLYDITIDFMYPTIMCILKDLRNKPAITIGLKTSNSLLEACLGALNESVQVRSWIRDNLKENIVTTDFKSQIINRGLLWADSEMTKNLNFLKNPKIKKIKKQKKYSHHTTLKTSINYFKKKNYDLIYCDLTLRELSDFNFFVYKCLSPQLVPLYLDENYKYLNSQRLNEKYFEYYNKKPIESDFNNIMHPFM
ncbi:MAG: YcaO-like family protein [archaeon]|nr:YcaO-like family protein [archaeon]